MKPSIRSKLEHISERYQEITALLADPDVQGDSNRFRDLSQEYAQVEPVSRCYQQYVDAENELSGAEEMLSDPEMAEQTRRRLFDRVAADDAVIAGYHFGFPNAGKIHVDGQGYAFEAFSA